MSPFLIRFIDILYPAHQLTRPSPGELPLLLQLAALFLLLLLQLQLLLAQLFQLRLPSLFGLLPTDDPEWRSADLHSLQSSAGVLRLNCVSMHSVQEKEAGI
jgi:hypothetical protein